MGSKPRAQETARSIITIKDDKHTQTSENNSDLAKFVSNIYSLQNTSSRYWSAYWKLWFLAFKMDEADKYLADMEEKLKKLASTTTSSSATIEDKLLLCKRQYEYGQLLCSLSKYKEAYSYFSDAWTFLQSYRDDEVYSTLYYSMSTQFASLLDYLGMSQQCEKLYEELSTLNPHGWHVGDLAFYLHRRKRDYDQAESCYKKALSYYPDHSSIHLKYAGFLRHVRKDLQGAEEQYKLAVASSPNSADALGSYASFLHGVHRSIEEAEALYRRAAEADDTHANNLCNYGLFLSEERRNFAEAEKMYRRVLQLTPKHTNTLYNYAVLLDTHLKRRAEAEQFYRRTLELESRHAFALYNLAVLLEELMAQQGGQGGLPEDQKREVAALYKRAVDADPRDPATLADYGRYLYMQLGEVAGAEQALQAALKQDAQCESALYHLALLTHKEQRSAPQATALLQRLLVVHPQHVNGLLALARVHADTVRSPELAGGERDRVLEQCVQLYEQAASLHREPAQVLAEYLRVLEAFGTARMKVVALRSAAGLLPKIDKAAEEDAVATCRALMDRIQKSVSY